MPGVGFSGKDGTVKIGSTDISEIRGWTFNPKSTNPRYASNKTGGYKRTVAGVKEGSGTCSGAYDTTTPHVTVIDVATAVSLLLYLDATHFFTVPSVIDDWKVTVDVDNGEIVGWEATFSTNGAWTNPTSPMMMPEGAMGLSAGSGQPADVSEIKATGVVDPKALEEYGFITKDQVKGIVEAARDAVREMLQEMMDRGEIHKSAPRTPPAHETATAGESPTVAPPLDGAMEVQV